MISGYDSVYLAHGMVSVAIERFLDGFSARWPEMRVVVEGEDEFLPWVPRLRRLPAAECRLLVARDRAMELSWDERGYGLDSKGEGPFALAYDHAPWKSIRAVVLDDPYGREGFAYSPYDVKLVGPDFSIVSLTAPPPESSFSRFLSETLEMSLAHERE